MGLNIRESADLYGGGNAVIFTEPHERKTSTRCYVVLVDEMPPLETVNLLGMAAPHFWISH